MKNLLSNDTKISFLRIFSGFNPISTKLLLFCIFKLLTVGGECQNLTSEVNIFNTNIPAARSAPVVVGVADNIIMIGGVTNDYEYSNTCTVCMDWCV